MTLCYLPGPVMSCICTNDQASQNNRKRPNTNPISSYFKKAEKKSEEVSEKNVTQKPTCCSGSEINFLTEIEEPSTSSISSQSKFTNENDIGLYVNANIDDFTKSKLLEQPWEPPKSYKFPHSLHTKNGKEIKRFLGPQHLEGRKWLVLSDTKQGLFCKFCVMFASEKCGHNKGVIAKTLVSQPLTSFAKLLGKDGHLQSHENTTYHKTCVQAGIDFLNTYRNPEKSVDNRVNSQRLQQVQENRERLRPIIQSIIFLGRQNIPLRGHRDDGRLDEEAGPSNEGNFRELLRFKVSSGDDALKRHLATASSRATYIGSKTQNQLIVCCGEEITETIIKQVSKAQYYSVIFDETTDISHTEQMSLNLRYVYNNNIREDFVKFIDAYESITTISQDGSEQQDPGSERCLTGEALGNIVVKLLQELSLDPNNCVGIGTDSCSVMSSEAVGAVTEIQKVAKNACRCPCLNHALNNSVSSSINVASVRNAVGVMKSVVSFFNMSAKRNQVLRSTLGHQLSGLCETRWVERHEGVIQFRSGFPQIVEALTSISLWRDGNTVATTLINSLCTPEFLISMMSLIDILKITLPLSRLLQTPSLDLNGASKAVKNTISTIDQRRSNCDENFCKIFNDTKVLAEEVDVEMKLPRLVKKQAKRANHPGNAEEYFRRSIYIPLLDNVCNDLKSRLSHSSLECFGLRGIIPSILTEACEENVVLEHLKIGFDKFSPIIGSGDKLTNVALFEGELELWKNHWTCEKEKGSELPSDILDVLEKCDCNIFPMIHSLLKILATLPVSVSTAERSFSTLRRVKSWLRGRMGEARLTGLCLLHVHRDINVDIDKIIERFAKKGPRRLEFVI